VGCAQAFDGIALHCKDKEKVESFKISDDLKLTFHDPSKQTLSNAVGMSVSCPTADSCAAANTISFDHFVGARTQLLLFLDDLALSLFGKPLLNH
jgi:hypothetical protein